MARPGKGGKGARSFRGDPSPALSPLGPRQALILANHIHGWRKPDLVKIISKAPLPTASNTQTSLA